MCGPTVGELSLPPSRGRQMPGRGASVSPVGFGVMPRGDLGHGCLPGHTSGVFDPSDSAPAWEALPGIGSESPEGVLSTGSDPSLGSLYKRGSRGGGWQNSSHGGISCCSLELQCEKRAIVGICCPLAGFCYGSGFL